MVHCDVCQALTSDLLKINCLRCNKQGVYLCSSCEDDSLCKACVSSSLPSPSHDPLLPSPSQEPLLPQDGSHLIATQLYCLDQDGVQQQMLLHLKGNSLSIKYARNTDSLVATRLLESACQLDSEHLLISGGCDQEVVGESVVVELSRHGDQLWFRQSASSCMECARMTHRLIRIDPKRVLAVGGINHTYLNSCELYLVHENRWHPLSPMKHPRSQPSLFLHQDKVYVYGGFMAQNTVAPGLEVFSPMDNTWTYHPLDFSPFGNQVVRSMSIVRDNQVLILGGSNGKEASQQVLQLDLEEMKVDKSSVVLNEPRVQGVALEEGGKVVVVGGAYQGRQLSAECLDMAHPNKVATLGVQDQIHSIQQYPHYMWLCVLYPL